jgi:hypothetical protein
MNTVQAEADPEVEIADSISKESVTKPPAHFC